MCRSRWISTLLALLAMPAAGCAILAPGEGRSGGVATLSDAITAANADSATKVRRMDVGDSAPLVAEDELEDEMVVEPGPFAPAPPLPPETPRVRKPGSGPLFGLIGGTGLLGGTDYDRYEAFGITGGNFETGRMRWDLLGTVSNVYFEGESRLGQAFRDAIDLELDVTGRYYFTEPHTFVGAYGIAGLGTGTLFWSYADRVPVIQDGIATTIGDDRINHFDLFAGLGTSLVQIRHLHVGANVVGGVRFYGWHTVNGFENTELPTTGFARVMLEVQLRR